jgi:polyhydroxyalkanoate synthesis regulator phasin
LKFDDYDIFNENKHKSDLLKELENATKLLEERQKSKLSNIASKKRAKEEEKIPDLFSYKRLWNVQKDLAAN